MKTIKIENYENSIMDMDKKEWCIIIPEIVSEVDSTEGIDSIEYTKGIDLELLDDSGGVKEYIHIESLAVMPDHFAQRNVNNLEKEIEEFIYNDSGISSSDMHKNSDRDFWNYTQK